MKLGETVSISQMSSEKKRVSVRDLFKEQAIELVNFRAERDARIAAERETHLTELRSRGPVGKF